MTGQQREKTGEEIAEAVRRRQLRELHAGARRDRDQRTDAEIIKAYQDRMAAKRGEHERP